MKRAQLVPVFLIAWVLLCSAPPAEAQRGSPYGVPSPTFSPWLNLYRSDPGPLGTYHTYVRPEQELYGTLRRQDAGLQRQRASIRSLQEQTFQRERAGTVRPTGTGSVFMNYSHYYPGMRSPGRRR